MIGLYVLVEISFMATVFLMCVVPFDSNDNGAYSAKLFSLINKQGDKINRLIPDTDFKVFCSESSNSFQTAEILSNLCLRGTKREDVSSDESVTSFPSKMDVRLNRGYYGINDFVESFRNDNRAIVAVCHYSDLLYFNSKIEWNPGTIWSEEHGLILPD
jgi:hypothetical protein